MFYLFTNCKGLEIISPVIIFLKISDAYRRRPESISVTLPAEDAECKNQELKEDVVAVGYTVSYTGDAEEGFTIGSDRRAWPCRPGASDPWHAPEEKRERKKVV